MFKKAIFFLLFTFNIGFAQSKIKRDSIPAIQVNLLNANYKDFVVIDKKIYAITKGDSLVVFDIEKPKLDTLIKNVSTIAKTTRKAIYYINNNGEINSTKDFKNQINLGKTNGNYNILLTTKSDDFVLINKYGIQYKGQIFVPKNRSHIYKSWGTEDKVTKYLSFPHLSYIDSENRVWLTYDNGEFGVDAWFFDLETKEFYEEDYLYLKSNRKLKKEQYDKELMDSFPDKIKMIKGKYIYKFPNQIWIRYGIKGISENHKGEIFVSQSLMHFSFNGELAIIKKSSIPDFYTNVDIKHILEYQKNIRKKEKYRILAEYIGANAFNKYNNSFYYYSNKGFFKIIEKDNAYSKEFIFRPWIIWKGGMSNAVGYQMNVIKFEFISENEIVFLTSNNGIGYFNGKEVKYFK